MSAPIPAPFPVVRPSDLRTSAASSTPWLIDQLWTTSAVGIIGGTPKTYKTWLALEMAVSVASGSACLATFAVSSPGPVLLYAAEDSESALRARLGRGVKVLVTDVFAPLWDATERVMHHTGLMRSRGAELRHDHAALIAALATRRGDEAAAAIEDELERLHRVIIDAALTTSSMLAPQAAPDDARQIRIGKTGRQGRAIEQ